MKSEPTQEQIDAANSLADYHLNEIREGLMPEVEVLTQGMAEDIRRRLIAMYYEGAGVE